MSLVVDASVIVALVVADERQDAAQKYLDSWLAASEGVHAPAVLPYEVANVLARRVFDGELELDEVPEIWQDLAVLGLVLHPFDLAHDGSEIAAVTARLRRRHEPSYSGVDRILVTVVRVAHHHELYRDL